jgi:hypothetical protein
VPARRSAEPPAGFDRTIDLDLRRLVAFWPDEGPLELRRALTAEERVAAERRAAELAEALRPHGDADRARVESALAAMLGGFRSMRQTGEDAETVVTVLRAVLREFPAWAVERACLRIARREAGLDARWAPNDAQVAEICRGVVAEYREALENAEGLLLAVVAKGYLPPKGGGTEVAKPPPLHRDTGYAARVADDLARRKAARENEPAEAESDAYYGDDVG